MSRPGGSTTSARLREARAETRSEPEQGLTDLASEIRRLGHRLQCPYTLSDPKIQAALNQLDKQVARVLCQSRGRHRLLPAGVDGGSEPEIIRDVWGYNLKPNPLTAITSAQFVSALRQYRAWSGNVSFRQMADRARQAVAHSTMCEALKGTKLPPLKVVIAIVVGCGGSREDQEKFVTAWRCINSGKLGQPGLRVVQPG